MNNDSATFLLAATTSSERLQVFATWVEIIQNLGLTLGAGIGLWLTWVGLTTWKHQHIGTTKWDLARRYVKQSYLVRNEISDARNPLQSIAVERKEGEERTHPTKEEEELAEWKHYWGLWNRVVEKMSELDVLSLELRAAGEPVFETLNRELTTNLWKYNSAIRAHLDFRTGRRKYDDNRSQEVSTILWRDTENKDEFSIRLAEVFERMEVESRDLMERIHFG